MRARLLVALVVGVLALRAGAAELSPDERLNAAYQALLQGSGEERQSVTLLQEAWVRERDRICGTDAGCVADLDEKRIAVIEGDTRFRDQLADNDVDQAFGLLPDEAVAAASVFRLHHTLKAKLGLAFALRLSGENSAEIADLLHQVAEVPAGERLRIDLPQLYDGSLEGLIPYVKAAGGQVALSCRLFERFPVLIGILSPEFGGSGDGLMPQVSCEPHAFPVPASEEALIRAFDPYDCDVLSARCGGSIRFMYYRMDLRNAVERAILPSLLLQRPPDPRGLPPPEIDAFPLQAWSLAGPWNRVVYMRLRHQFIAARADLARALSG